MAQPTAEVSIVDALCARFEGVAPRGVSRDPAVTVAASRLREVARALRDDYGYEVLTCVSGVDWLGESPRFGVYYHFLSFGKRAYVCVYAACEGDDEPRIPSLADLYPSADWHERETYDMYGIRFEGHPDLRRILMWEKYPYHPLRKEFPLAGLDADFPAPDIGAETKVRVSPAPEQGGPFHAQVGPADMTGREPRGLDQSWSEKHPKP